MNDTCLDFRNPTLGYRAHAVVHHLNGSVRRGSLTAVVGANGSGLLRLKGIAALADDPGRPAVVNAVQHKLYSMNRLEAWPGESQRTELVLIGRHLGKQQIGELFAHLLPVAKRPTRRAI